MGQWLSQATYRLVGRIYCNEIANARISSHSGWVLFNQLSDSNKVELVNVSISLLTKQVEDVKDCCHDNRQ